MRNLSFCHLPPPLLLLILLILIIMSTNQEKKLSFYGLLMPMHSHQKLSFRCCRLCRDNPFDRSKPIRLAQTLLCPTGRQHVCKLLPSGLFFTATRHIRSFFFFCCSDNNPDNDSDNNPDNNEII